MHRSILLRRSGLSVAAAVVLLTGCGGSDGEDSAPETPMTAAESTAVAAGSEFCTQAASIQERLEATAGGVSDPTELPQVMQRAADEIRAIDAPAEIEADWSALADGAQRLSETLSGIDFSDPNALATLEQELTPLQQDLETASTNVETYLRDDCGIDVSAGSATPGG
ncbi:hypothetical protein GCU60_09800 [Blastococcus saxobsidens]|uniref:Uncharacterized protein n=1 Tax=Blastococcus saxobsidens TaxID=138336 RepID=A0A6L9W2S6_9ACTN|nr:hypothetical protein [Blastococcus saxobsidens]NEK86049.1 hypothetical protein [Blastococcus saxobsidens]